MKATAEDGGREVVNHKENENYTPIINKCTGDSCSTGVFCELCHIPCTEYILLEDMDTSHDFWTFSPLRDVEGGVY
jgi:hypothetical protein